MGALILGSKPLDACTFVKVILVGMLAITAAACGQPHSTISGTLLGHDGEVVPAAHVALFASADLAEPDLISRVGKDGSFQFDVAAKGVVVLRFSAVHHEPVSVPVLIPNSRETTVVRVSLGTPQFETDFSRVAIIGDFNGFKRDGNEVVMRPAGEKRFMATISGLDGETLAYQLINMTAQVEAINSTVPGPAMEGTAATEFRLARDGRYLSVTPVSEGVAEILLDTASLPPPGMEPRIEVDASSSDARTFSEHVTVLRAERQHYTEQRLELKRRNADTDEIMRFVNGYDWDRFHTPIRWLLEDEVAQATKNAAMVAYISEIGDVSEMTHSQIDRTIAKYTLKNVAPTSALWARFPDAFLALIWADQIDDIERFDIYFDQISTSHPNDRLREAILNYGLSVAYFAEDSARAARIYQRLVDDFPDSSSAASARKIFAPDRRISPGREVPPFQVASLDDPEDVFSEESLRGRIYLIDFWGTWCAPCIAEMPELHEAFTTFKDRGFTILSLSCDESPERVADFRSGRWPMPWLHGFLSECYHDRHRNQLVRSFEVVGFPSHVLVDRDGTIVQTGPALRGRRLITTLDGVFAAGHGRPKSEPDR